MRTSTLVLVAVLVIVLALGGVGLYVFSDRNTVPTTELPAVGVVASTERDPAEFGNFYPRHYDSFQRNYEMSQAPSVYGGSEPVSKLEQYPYLKTLFGGYGFSKEYNEDRGHVYTVEDVLHIERVGAKTTATCMTCKSAEVPDLIEKYGDAYWKKNFHEIAEEVSNPISCSDCHDPETMQLKLSRVSLVNALERLGRDVDSLSVQEMRSLTCAQCHVEYYFDPDTKAVTFPWDKGFDPEDMYAYYQEIGFADWTHPDTGASMLKVQHPEYELFQDSTHQSAGLSCADCHMPFMVEGNTKLTSHWWTSPLKHMNQSCTTCHRQSAEELRERVLYTQDKVAGLLQTAGETIEEAIGALKETTAGGQYEDALVEEARALHREAQWYWDYVGAENSMGFHNPQKAMATLGRAIDLAHQAYRKALEARSE